MVRAVKDIFGQEAVDTMTAQMLGIDVERLHELDAEGLSPKDIRSMLSTKEDNDGTNLN